MVKSDYKTVKISPELHKKIKTFCDKNGLKLNIWIEKKLTEIIEKIIKEENE